VWGRATGRWGDKGRITEWVRYCEKKGYFFPVEEHREGGKGLKRKDFAEEVQNDHKRQLRNTGMGAGGEVAREGTGELARSAKGSGARQNHFHRAFEGGPARGQKKTHTKVKKLQLFHGQPCWGQPIPGKTRPAKRRRSVPN